MDARLPDLADLERTELEEALVALGVPRFHGRQIFHWIHARATDKLRRMTNLPRALRDDLAQRFSLDTPTVLSSEASADGTTKFLLQLADGRHIEAVYIPDTPAQTFCISTQVGCAMAVRLLPDGQDGTGPQPDRRRDRGPGARARARDGPGRSRPFNIVLMGMGEPLHNYDATMKALRIMADERRAGRARRAASRCRRSACCRRSSGSPPSRSCRIWRFRCTRRPTSSAIALVPINRKHTLEELIDGVPPLSARQATPHHVRVRAARRRERHAARTRGGSLRLLDRHSRPR